MPPPPGDGLLETKERDELVAEKPPRGLRTTSLVIVAVVASAFALYFGREFFVPIVFAVLLSALLRPLVGKLERLGLPTAIGASIIVLVFLGVLVGAGFALAGPVQR